MAFNTGESVLLVSPVSVPEAEQKRIQQCVGETGSVFYIRHCDLGTCGYPSSSFDGCVAIGGSVDHTKTFFQSISSLLKPGGKFYLTEPIAESENDIKVILSVFSSLIALIDLFLAGSSYCTNS